MIDGRFGSVWRLVLKLGRSAIRRAERMAAIAESHSAEHSNFDAAQGGIFEARFDNELLGANSTVGPIVRLVPL